MGGRPHQKSSALGARLSNMGKRGSEDEKEEEEEEGYHWRKRAYA
jgi:hypothetical protein